eukprot:4134629-Pyramimonas_sp.AAC.1
MPPPWAQVAPIRLQDHIPEIISSTRKSVKGVSKQCRNNVGRVYPRTRHVKTLEFRLEHHIPGLVFPVGASWVALVATAGLNSNSLVRTHPRRGLGSSGIGTFWFPQKRKAVNDQVCSRGVDLRNPK